MSFSCFALPTLVPRLCLGTHRPRGSASRRPAAGKVPFLAGVTPRAGRACKAARSQAEPGNEKTDSFPGSAWERTAREALPRAVPPRDRTQIVRTCVPTRSVGTREGVPELPSCCPPDLRGLLPSPRFRLVLPAPVQPEILFRIAPNQPFQGGREPLRHGAHGVGL